MSNLSGKYTQCKVIENIEIFNFFDKNHIFSLFKNLFYFLKRVSYWALNFYAFVVNKLDDKHSFHLNPKDRLIYVKISSHP